MKVKKSILREAVKKVVRKPEHKVTLEKMMINEELTTAAILLMTADVLASTALIAGDIMIGGAKSGTIDTDMSK